MRGVGRAGADGDHRVDAAHVRQPEVHQRHVGPMLLKQLDRFAAGRRLRHHDHVGLVGDDRGDAFAQQRMVVDAEDTDAAWSRS